VPYWVILICAVTMGLGTMAGGWRIIRTMGSKMIKLKPVHGFAAETSAAAVILTASHFGIPVSTTHIISTSIMGVGSTKGANALKLGHRRQHRHGLGVDHSGLHGDRRHSLSHPAGLSAGCS
jgi:inorganic phosphate transporter, PiT family